MNAKTRQAYTAKAEIFKAMGHPTRLFILEELGRGPRCVCELREMVGADMSTVSKHLTILRNAGLVDSEKQGTMVIYHLACTCFSGFSKCLESVMQRRRELLEATD